MAKPVSSPERFQFSRINRRGFSHNSFSHLPHLKFNCGAVLISLKCLGLSAALFLSFKPCIKLEVALSG